MSKDHKILMKRNRLIEMLNSGSIKKTASYPHMASNTATRKIMYYAVFGLVVMSSLMLAAFELELIPVQWNMDELIALVGSIYTTNL